MAWDLRSSPITRERPSVYGPHRILGSVPICFFLHAIAAFKVLRIHSETFWSFALAAAVMRFTSSVLKRTGTIRPLASPFGSLGRPIFGLVCFAMFPELLHNCGLYCGLWRYNGRDVKYRDVTFRMSRIFCRVNPGVDPIRLRMTSQAKDFNNPVPYCLTLKTFRNWHAF